MSARRDPIMGGTIWPSLCGAIIACTIAAPAAAAPADGAELLAEAPVYALLRPAIAFEVLGELNGVLRKSSPMHRQLFERTLSQGRRELGFDPTSAQGLQQIGVDPAAPVWASMGAFPQREVKSVVAQLQRLVGKALAGGPPLAEALAKVPVVAAHSRLVFGVADQRRLRAFLERVGFLAEDEQALAARVGSRAGKPAASALGRGLAQLSVLGAAWLDRRTLVVLRVVDKRAVVDLLHAWAGDARTLDAAGARGLLRPLTLPSGAPSATSSPLAKAAFTSDAGLAVLLRAAPLAQLAELGLELQLLGTIPYMSGSSAKAIWKAGQAEVRRCVTGWRGARALTGDTALRLTVNKRQWHAKAWWSLPSGTMRSLSSAVVRDAAVDPTRFASAVAFAGANLALGKLGADLAKGPFRIRGKAFARLASECSTLTLATMSTGGWLGLLAPLLAEAKREATLAPVVGGLRNGIVVLRALPGAASRRSGDPGAVLVHFEISGGGALRAKLDAAAAAGSASKSNFSFGGAKTVVYRGLPGMRDVALALTDQGHGAVGVTIAPQQRVEDIGWFLRQARPAKGVLPASVLAYGHLNLPAVLQQVTANLPGITREMVGAPLKALTDRLGRLRANLSLEESRLVGEIVIDRK